jgi:hypothetical protein
MAASARSPQRCASFTGGSASSRSSDSTKLTSASCAAPSVNAFSAELK